MAASYRKTPVLKTVFNSEYCENFKSTYFKEHLWMAASENVTMKLRKFKIYLYRVLILHYKTGFFNTNISISWLVSHEVYICIKYLFDMWEMWTSFEFWPMKNISENYKPMRVWLWLAYRFTENYCCFLRVHSNSKEVSYLTWQNVYPNLKTACHIKQTFFL